MSSARENGERPHRVAVLALEADADPSPFESVSSFHNPSIWFINILPARSLFKFFRLEGEDEYEDRRRHLNLPAVILLPILLFS